MARAEAKAHLAAPSGSQYQETLRLGLDKVGGQLIRWLRKRLPAGSPQISDLAYPVGAGFSNETILFRMRWNEGRAQRERDLVLRIAPGEFQLFRETNFEKQFKLLSVLHASRRVRAPEPLWYEPDPALFGRPFFIMSRLIGQVPVSRPSYNAEGFLFDATPRERERLWTNALYELSCIARTPTAELGFLRGPSSGLDGFQQHFADQETYYRWAAVGRQAPILEDTLAWLHANVPPEGVEGLSWGDARIGNMIFDERFNVAAVLDWEQLSLGGGLCDLGWWLLFDNISSAMSGVARLEGLGGRERTIALWSDFTGIKVPDLLWFEVLAAFTLSAILVRKFTMEGRSLPGENINNNRFSRQITRLRGLDEPRDLIEIL